MKRILLTVSYWSASVLMISLMLISLGYCFSDAMFVSMSFVPGCLVLRWLLPHISFSDTKKGVLNLVSAVLAVILTDILLVIWCHILMNGMMASFYSGFPTLLVNPAFLALVMIVLTGGDYVLSRYLKSRFRDEPHPANAPTNSTQINSHTITRFMRILLYVNTAFSTNGTLFSWKAPITFGFTVPSYYSRSLQKTQVGYSSYKSHGHYVLALDVTVHVVFRDPQHQAQKSYHTNEVRVDINPPHGRESY